MKHLKQYEAYSDIDMNSEIDKLINWKMIYDIKDMALEYLDEGLKLIMTIYADVDIKQSYRDLRKHRLHEGKDSVMLYKLRYSHGEDNLEKFRSYIENKCYINVQPIKVKYYIYVYTNVADRRGRLVADKTVELVNRVSDAYPMEIIIH